MHNPNSYNDNDIKTIQYQLQKTTINIIGITKKCIHNKPMVILLKPILESNNFHTAVINPLWLSCPYLHKQIHTLESNGYIKKIEEFINSDKLLQKKMIAAHVNFYYFRKMICQKFLPDYYNISLLDSGIGGIKDLNFIKCLHLHVAHKSIFNNNVAGNITELLLDNNIYCKKGTCENDNNRK